MLNRPKSVNYDFSLLHLNVPYVVGKLWVKEAQICSFNRIYRKIKQIKALESFGMKTENFHSTTGNHEPLQGPTLFLQCSYMSLTPLKSSGLAGLKYAISAGQDAIVKSYGSPKFWHESLEKFQLTRVKHGLEDG